MAHDLFFIMKMENTMLPLATPSADKRAWLVLGAGLCAVLAWLLYRNLGLHPAIFADEWYYSKMARLTPLSESILPSYLYLWLTSFSNSCGTGFLDCVRLGNAALFVGAGPFLYLIARQVTRPAIAIALTLLCLLAPVNLYSAFFMPEAPYYFGYIVLSWLLLTRTAWSWPALALGAGLVLGLMSLVKVHALFLIPAVSVFLVGVLWLQKPHGAWLRNGLAGALIVIATTFVVKFGLGYLLAGEPALSIFGSFYDGTASSNTGRPLGRLAAAAFINGRGHLMTLAILMPLPMATLLLFVLSARARRDASPAFNRLCLYVFLTLGATAGVTVIYTASIADIGPLEVIRLHLRYYSFTFPLLVLLAAAGAGHLRATAPRARPVAALLVGATIVAGLFMLPRYAITPIDGPEIAAISLTVWTGWAIVALGLLSLGLWAAGNRLATPLFLFLLFPAMLAKGLETTNAYLNQLKPGWPADNGGIAARDHVPPEERKLITVASDTVMDIMRAQFHIDDKDTAMLELAKGAPLESYQIPVRNKWLLVIGEHALPPELTPVLKTDEYALIKLSNDFRQVGSAALSQPIGPDSFVTRAEGLSGAEPWGRWSDAKQVVLHFAQPLPRKFDVVLKARAYGDNTLLPFTMRVGDQSAMFRLPASDQEIRLRFNTDGTQRSLEIDVPKPTAPSSLGQWPDDRPLGIGIADIGIGTSADQDN